MREKIADWFTGKDTFFLIGAGCSVCAGKPLMSQLTAKVVAEIGESGKELFEKIRPAGGQTPNLEHLMNHLIRRGELMANLDQSETLGSMSRQDIGDLLQKIRAHIVKYVGAEWVPSEVHKRFLSRIRPGSHASRDIFSLNYDTLIEATLDELRLPYVDGFRGSGKAWFDASAFDDAALEEGRFSIHKLHGSISWRRQADGYVRRLIDVPSTDEAVLVYPSEQKYVETRFGVYEQLLTRFRNRMRVQRPNNTLIILGYSFGDEHINEAIFDALCSKGNNLTLFAFVGPLDGPNASADQIEQFRGFAERCGARFNAFVGRNHAITTSVEDSEKEELLKLELWKFENAVNSIAGGAE